MDDIFLYFVKLPEGIEEVVMPCIDGYTVYIDPTLSYHQQLEAYNHALRHIKNHDWEKHDVQKIEHEAHKKTAPAAYRSDLDDGL